MSRLAELRKKRDDAKAAAGAIVTAASLAGQDDLTPSAEAVFNSHLAAANRAAREIDEIETAEASSAPAARTPRIQMGADRRQLDPAHGFLHFGEFAAAVRAASLPGSTTTDPRLQPLAAAPGTFGSEGVGADGGHLVPSAFATAIFSYALQADSLLTLCDNTPVEGNSMVFPRDETTPWGTDGIRAYWQAEATAATLTKPKIGGSMMRLNKLMALVPLTDELAADASALGSYLPSRLGDAIRWRANESLLWGDGNGQLLGIMNGGGLIVQGKESGQAAATINLTNVGKMFARMASGGHNRAVWLAHPDAIAHITSLSASPVQLAPPPTDFPLPCVGTLLGRPVICNEHMASLGAQGDFAFIDFTKFRAITKAAGIETARSMHLYFDAGLTAFRTTFRIDGQPAITAAVTPPTGSNTVSPFVVLQAR